MKKYFWFICFLLPVQLLAQDTTMNSLTKDMDASANEEKKSVQIFKTSRTINANTTEMVGRGKLDFRVTHNFGDIGGKFGGIKKFFGLDESTDVRIGFHIGLTDRLDLHLSHAKGSATIKQLYELALKLKLMDQLENDHSHPISMALFVNDVVSAVKAVPDSLHRENSYGGFSDRMSQTIQLIIARKFGKVSLQLNPTFVHTNYVTLNDDKSMFALGGAIRVPFTRNFSFIVDYFHPFRSKSSKNFLANQSPSNPNALKFYDPIGISFEITTAGHVFNLNFTNATEILENRFIPRTNSTWSKWQFRWGFTISRKFVLWRRKS